MVGRKPVDLVGVARPHIDLLVAEHKRGPRYPALARIEHLDLHAEDFLIPLNRARHVGDIDHEMIDRVHFDRHELILWSRFDARLAYWPYHALFVTTRADRQFNYTTGCVIPDIREKLAWFRVAPRFF
jgi:hypothetical protein